LLLLLALIQQQTNLLFLGQVYHNMAIAQQIFMNLDNFVPTTGSHTNNASGTYNFTVPVYRYLTIQIWGGGGAGANNGSSGGTGGTSSFGSYISATGGAGGTPGTGGTGGAGGSGTNGTYNETGENGKDGAKSTSSYGGAGANTSNGGGARRTTTYVSSNVAGQAGFTYAGGGSGPVAYSIAYGSMAGGGGGGYASKTFGRGELSTGTTVSITLGAGGTAVGSSGAGANGAIKITWS
jgi:hypothetical protein